ncbi:MAG: lysophospholipid acyltransferase family protein [Ferruginibacter sp.]|nr:lysophospholipid acyltransferase family protein [Ferruginibacter sp.]
MSAIIYYLSLPFIYLLSLLPFPMLYFLSDGLYLLLYYVTGYRKKVVLDNLKNSFPEKTTAEIIVLHKKFYRYFCDLFLETLKTLTISRKKMLEHCRIDPGAELLFKELAKENKSIIVVMGHKGNWEWAGNTFSLCCKHQLYVIYHPLTNKYLNGLMCKMRKRFGTKLIPMKDTFRDMIKNRQELNATAFIADQSPNPANAHWMNFLNQDTAVFMGTEKIAQKIKYPIVFVSVQKLTRGYYVLMAELLQRPPYIGTEGDITETHTRKLESDIIAQPETWLWTHKRWKHKRF